MSKKKRIMRAFKIHEISAVDTPAQEGARMVLMKRAPEVKDEDLIEKVAVLTSSEFGHSHLIYDTNTAGGCTSYATKEGDGYSHEHPYVVKDDGTIVIGEVNGHTHGIAAYSKSVAFKEEDDGVFYETDYAYVGKAEDPSTWELRITKSAGGSPDKDLVIASVESLSLNSLKHLTMPESLQEAIHKLRRAWLETNPDNELPTVIKLEENEMTVKPTDPKAGEGEAALKAELALAKAFGELNDTEKAFHGKLTTDAEKSDFVNKSAAERKALMEKAADSDTVIYKSADGTEYRKSDDPRMVSLAKQADENAKVAKAAQEALTQANLEKRANEELPNLPGTPAVKAAMLKAIDSIEDEAARAEAMKTLKAGNSAIAAAFTSNGHLGKNKDAVTAEEQLNNLAKKYSEDFKVDYTKAYDAVVQTPEGARLYSETVKN